MAIDSVSKIGEYLGQIFVEQDKVDREISPEDGEFVNTVEDHNSMVIGGRVKGYKLIFADDSFIIDHPIQGEIDSSVYKIDGGYRNPAEVHFDLSYPILWDQGFKEKIFEKNLIES